MEDRIAELQRQIEEERKAREEAERRLEQVRKAREEAERRQEETERQQQPSTLLHLLDRCHKSLSQAIQVETDATLTTQGDATNPVNRLYPKRIVPWGDFPQLQEQVWRKFDSTDGFTSRRLFPNDNQIDYIVSRFQGKRIYSEESLRIFEGETVDSFVEWVIKALRDDEVLSHEFGIRGPVTFYDRANTFEPLLEDFQDAQTAQRVANARHGRGRGRERGAAQSQKKVGTTRRRNRRADQFCVHVAAHERQVPVYAVEFKAPHKVTIPELVAGLHPIDLARDVIDQDGDTFEFYATRLVAAVVTQIFSYMIDSAVRYGYICTGEAFVFLHIPKDDPTVVQYFLCIPNQDVQADDELRLHRTAIAQVLGFTLQALGADAPSQEWLDEADKLTTWEVEYSDVLREIPETLRKDPPASNYRPSHWKRDTKIHNTRSRARCQPNASTPTHSSTEDSGSEEESQSPSIAAASRSRSSRGRGNNRKSTQGSGRTQTGGDNKQTSLKDGELSPPYCTIACISGIVNKGPLDKKCPNWKLHGGRSHSIGPREFTRQLHGQLARDRELGFEPLHIRGRTGFMMKATLLSRGYTVIVKAATAEMQHRLQAEADNYHRLRSLQGQLIPVCLGTFMPRVRYWYHGQIMDQMMILSWSGRRLQFVINDENSKFYHQEREKALAILRSHGVVHGDSEWRNMLWDDRSGRLFVIDLEDLKWLKRPGALEPTSGNASRRSRAKARESKQTVPSSSTAVCT